MSIFDPLKLSQWSPFCSPSTFSTTSNTSRRKRRKRSGSAAKRAKPPLETPSTPQGASSRELLEPWEKPVDLRQWIFRSLENVLFLDLVRSLEKVFVEDDIRHSWVLKIRIFTKL